MTDAPSLFDKPAKYALIAAATWLTLNFNETVLWKLLVSVAEAL